MEARPGQIRVAESSTYWNFVANFSFLGLVFAFALAPLGLEQVYAPGWIAGWPPTGSPTDLAILMVTGIAGVVVAALTFFGAGFMRAVLLGGAFKYPRKVRSLEVLRVTRMESPMARFLPRWWTLACRGEEGSLTVTVIAGEDRLREALRLGGVDLPPGRAQA